MPTIPGAGGFRRTFTSGIHQPSTHELSTQTKFVYDGWNLIAVLGPQSAVLRSFVWGLDLSGSLQGAGGIGGLLAIADFSLGSHFTSFDGNGNLVTPATKCPGVYANLMWDGPIPPVLVPFEIFPAPADIFRTFAGYVEEDRLVAHGECRGVPILTV